MMEEPIFVAPRRGDSVTILSKTQGSVHKSTSLPADVTSSAEEYGIASLFSEPGGQKYGLSWFDDFQMVDDESVVDQAYKISRMVADHAKSCPRLHMVLNDKVELVNVIIERLPVSWEDYAATLKDMQMQKELSFGALVNHLRVEEKKRAQVEEKKRAQHQKVEEEEKRAVEEEEERAQYQKVEEEEEFVEEKKEYSRYLPLYKAALRGDWETAEKFFDQDPGALTAPINEYSETALMLAAVQGRNTNDFVKKLLDRMPPGSVDEAYGDVLNLAAYVGNTEAVKAILSKNPSLVYYRDDTSPIKKTPFTQAAVNGMRDTLLYLLELVKNDEDSSKLFPDEDSAALLMVETICSGYYDIALYLVKKYPLSAFSMRNNRCFGLTSLATRGASAFKSGTHYRWWQRIIYAHVPVKSVDYNISPTLTVLVENPVNDPDQVMRRKYNWARLLVEYFCISVPWIKHIQKQKEMHLQTLELVKCFCKGIASLPDSAKHKSLTQQAMLSAASNGIPEIVHEIVESFPSVLWTRDKKGRRVFEKAVLERQENAFNLVYQMGKYSRNIFLRKYDDKSTNILHLAGKLAPPTKLSQISGAALQMQLELQWFEAVKKLMSPRDIDWRNYDRKTPAMIFTEEHKKLVAEGEKWMKDTANSCTISAALIVTVVFAAAITVPGGINGTNGVPVFNKEVVFNIFAVSDAISLFTSTTSLLVHLSILTSRFAERDFLVALPKRLIIGLFTLFLSITAMLIAFSCAIYLLFGNRAWILYPVAGLACVPIISFASLQYPLLRDLMKSTYGPGIFGKQSEVPFFN